MSVVAAAAAAAGTASVAPWLSVNGGTSGSPTNLSTAVANGSYTKFLLGDGYYNNTTITRAGITIKALNQYGAIMSASPSLEANNVTIDGLSRTATGTCYEVYNQGCKVLNCKASGFGKTGYANGIWVFKDALTSSGAPVIVQGNLIEDFGGDQFIGGIAVGLAADAWDIDDIRVHIIGNTVNGWTGATTPAIYNASIQSHQPAYIAFNVCNWINGTPLQMKGRNSVIYGNECLNCAPDGCLYNREQGGNVWQYNIVHDCDYGLDHFRGNGVTYTGNLIYNCNHAGRIKVMEGGDSHDVTFEDMTFYNCGSGFEWDASGGGTFSNILWRRSIWHTVTGAAIVNQQTAAWDETDNLFYLTTEPTGTTGAGGTSDADVNPQFANPPTDFTASAAEAEGRGAPWPMPWA